MGVLLSSSRAPRPNAPDVSEGFCLTFIRVPGHLVSGCLLAREWRYEFFKWYCTFELKIGYVVGICKIININETMCGLLRRKGIHWMERVACTISIYLLSETLWVVWEKEYRKKNKRDDTDKNLLHTIVVKCEREIVWKGKKNCHIIHIFCLLICTRDCWWRVGGKNGTDFS